MKGVNIGGMNIQNLRYADDTLLLAEGPMDLQAFLTAVTEKGKPYGEEVLNKMKTKRSLLCSIQKRKCRYFGHIIRRDNLQRLLMVRRTNCRRGRGRPRTMWTDYHQRMDKNIIYNDCIRVAQNRERWRSMTADLLTTDGRHTMMMMKCYFSA